MPPLFESMFVETVKTKFRSFNIALPTLVSSGRPPNIGQFLAQPQMTSAIASSTIQPVALGGTSGLASRLGIGSPAPAPRPTATPLSVPPALVRSASNDKVDVDFQIESNNEINTYIGRICHAIVGAHDNWRFSAFFKGIQINGNIATGGSISGPLLSTNLLMYGPQDGLWGMAPAYTRAIADGLASCWREWERSVRVPGLKWYPMFMALPFPVAPPTPNTPTPMSMLEWSPTSLLPGTIATTMARKLALPGPYSSELFASIAAGFATAVSMWFPTQQVTQVMGRGPIPTFAPPYVPVGPVVGGDNIEPVFGGGNNQASHFAT